MQLHLRVLACGLGFLAAQIGCNSEKKGNDGAENEQKDAITISSKELAAEYLNDEAATKKKYASKSLNVSGKIVGYNKSGGQQGLELAGVKPEADSYWRGNVRCVTFKDKNPWSKVAPGQTLTVRGEWPSIGGLGPELMDCEIVTVDGTGIALTAEQLGKAIDTDFEKTVSEYDGKTIVLTGTVTKAELDDDQKSVNKVELKFAGKCVIEVWFAPSEVVPVDRLKVGDQIKVVGDISKVWVDKQRLTLDKSWYVGRS
jgi:hypothetical protein